MEKKELKEYLKKHLKLKIKTSSAAYGCSGDITISILLDEEEITKDSFDGSDIEQIIPYNYEG